MAGEVDEDRGRTRLPADPHPTIPTRAAVRICGTIAPERETATGVRFQLSLAERWQALTEPVPLAGAEALVPDPGGGLPALESEFDRLEREGAM